MAGINQTFRQTQSQKQSQIQKLSQIQIQGLNYLAMSSDDLRNEIYKAVSENPALEIVRDPQTNFQDSGKKTISRTSLSANDYQKILENNEDNSETLQDHLLHQLNSMNLSPDEQELSEKLIYNLDKNGFYGSTLNPSSLLNKTRILQNDKMLEKCIQRIQALDPIGTCCKTPEESLYIQAKLSGQASELTLFILNGHLDFLNPPEPAKIQKKLIDFKTSWHKKSFASELPIDNLKLSQQEIEDSLHFILTLNPRPAGEYISNTNYNFEKPDVVLSISRIRGSVFTSDYSKGIIAGNKDFYFQVKYASGVLPEIQIAKDYSFDKENLDKARNFLNILQFRENSIVLQGCAIVQSQIDFFLNGTGHLKPLTRRQIASQLGIHESTVSRMSAKNGSKFLQTEWGVFPASYFFTSGVYSKSGNEKISADTVKNRINQLISNSSEPLSDNKLTALLNEEGIKIARRTVAKYRAQSGLNNSYKQK